MRSLSLLALPILFSLGCNGASSAEPLASASAPSAARTPLAHPSALSFSRARFPVEIVPLAAHASGFAPRALLALDVSAPHSAIGAQHLSVRSIPDFDLALEPIGLRDVAGTVEDGSVVYAAAAPDTDVIIGASADGLEEIRVLGGPSAPSIARWRVRRGAAVATLRVRQGRVEALDEKGVIQLSAAPMIAIDANGVKRVADVRLEGDELSASLDVTGLSYPIALDPLWTSIAPMANRRNYGTGQVLSDGTFLAVGGQDGATSIAVVEVFDPKTNAWTITESQPSANANVVSARLGASTIVIGENDGERIGIYNTGSKAWTLHPPDLLAPRKSKAEIIPYSTNQVIVFGSFPNSAETYTLGGTAWVAAGTFLSNGRQGVTGAKLPDGKVIAMGGSVPPGIFASAVSVSTTEIWSPTTRTWSAGPSMLHKRTDSLVVTLPTGALLVIGGYDDNPSPSVDLSSCEIWDPTTKTFKATGSMATGRTNNATATLLPTGKVLVAGGASIAAGTTAELYDPATGKWTTAGPLLGRRGAHIAGLLGDGRVLIAGGNNASVNLSSVEIFQQSANGKACSQPYECISGNCVDGTCCNSAACGAGEVCTTGSCAKKGESSCTKDSECSTTHCVDGVCCDTACDQQCQACDMPGLVGKCSNATGAPHGARTACTGDIVGGECGNQCDGKDPIACHLLGATAGCGMRTCVDGTATGVGVCDGAGRCGTTPTSCGGYGCGTDACKTECAGDADCAATHQCIDKRCVARGATCSADNASAIEASGKTTDCTPFICKAGGCLSSCTVSTDCISGLCGADGKCSPAPEAATDSGGGCAMSSRSGGSAAIAFLALSFLARRRRRGA